MGISFNLIIIRVNHHKTMEKQAPSRKFPSCRTSAYLNASPKPVEATVLKETLTGHQTHDVEISVSTEVIHSYDTAPASTALQSNRRHSLAGGKTAAFEV
jgi:hypothetical protein